VSWEVQYTDQFDDWWEDLSEEEQVLITAAVEVLQEDGPALRRPLVDVIKQSRHANMKELVPPSTNIRVLFAFDPKRNAILLIGGDKTGDWNDWYDRMVPVADDLYDDHLKELAQEKSEST
jgi:hypothetical protein